MKTFQQSCEEAVGKAPKRNKRKIKYPLWFGIVIENVFGKYFYCKLQNKHAKLCLNKGEYYYCGRCNTRFVMKKKTLN